MRVVAADDHPLVIEGIRAALREHEEIELVGEATNGAQVLPLVDRLRPDVVLLDLRMPRMDGFTCIEMLRRRFPETKVVMLSAYGEPQHIHGALTRGASGYIVKGIDPRDLPSALRQAVEETVFTTVGPGPGGDTAGAGDLTERETTILRAAAKGLTNRAIARQLWVTEQTVKFHLTNIYRKLGVGNRTEAARAAVARGLVESPAVDATLESFR